MNGLKIFAVLIGIVFFGVENTYGKDNADETSIEIDDYNLN